MKILICGQQRMLAEALACALDARGYDILAVTTSVSGAPSPADDCVPDVCLLGLQPGRQPSGPDTVRAILRRYPGTKVLVLSETTDPETLLQFMRSGAAGLTHQDQSVAQIAVALDAIEAGRSVLDPGPLRFPARDRNRLCELSPREKEILTRIAAGQGTRQMSCAMNITVDTVRTYVKNVLAKLGAHAGCNSPPSPARTVCSSTRRRPLMSSRPWINGSARLTAARCLRRGREPGDGDGSSVRPGGAASDSCAHR